MKEIIVRRMKTEEYSLLKEFTYMAIYVPHGVKMPPKSIVEQPALKIYYQDFGTEKGDICLVAESDNKIVGAVWTRIVNDFAHIDDDTPSLAIAVAIESRGKGIGTRLLNKMLAVLKDEGFLSVSLSVQKENFAVKMYKRAGFEVVKDNGEELIMLKTYNAIQTADIEDAEHICSLVQSTIKKVYPRYYAKEAVDFFCKLHSVEAIIKDIEQGSVKILLKGDKIVATGSRTGNLIAKRKSQGCLGVEMECAASIAVARFRNIPFVQFLFGADNLDCEEYDMRDLILYGRNVGNKYLSLAFECGIRLI